MKANCDHYQGVCLTFLVCPVEAERKRADAAETDAQLLEEAMCDCGRSGIRGCHDDHCATVVL